MRMSQQDNSRYKILILQESKATATAKPQELLVPLQEIKKPDSTSLLFRGLSTAKSTSRSQEPPL